MGENVKRKEMIMKKHIVFAMVLALVLAGCGSAPSPPAAVAAVSAAASGVSLDAAIAQAAERMEARLPAGSKVALISVSSPSQTFSKYVLDRLESVLVNNGKLVVVDRANLDKVREEQGFQMSGEVSDESAKAIGKLIGADAIVTGSLVSLGSLYQLTLKAINMESAVVAASHQADIAADERVRALLGQTGVAAGSAAGNAAASGSGKAAAPAQSAAGAGAAAPAKPAEPEALGAQYAEEVLQGEMDLLDALDWIAQNAQSGGKYTIALGKDEAILPTQISAGGKTVTITLKAASGERTVSFAGSSPAYSLFTISKGVTFTLEDGVTLRGSQNDADKSVVKVDGGKFIMNGGVITGNKSTGWGAGVYIDSGTFTMNAGLITGNRSKNWGGGVGARNTASFTMNGGTISENTGDSGGGVAMWEGTFTMNGGTITRNTSEGYDGDGGGVYAVHTFIMNDGVISENTTAERGGGVSAGIFTMNGGTISGNSTQYGGGVNAGTFTMKGGTISGNTAREGGGVRVRSDGKFIKTGGIIYGSNAPDGQANTAIGDDSGHAVAIGGGIWSRPSKKRNTTARASTAMDSSKDGPAGGWE
ncbi:MAG: putative lipoprotein [Treponematales bacterium]